jgi:hypothetical protein
MVSFLQRHNIKLPNQAVVVKATLARSPKKASFIDVETTWRGQDAELLVLEVRVINGTSQDGIESSLKLRPCLCNLSFTFSSLPTFYYVILILAMTLLFAPIVYKHTKRKSLNTGQLRVWVFRLPDLLGSSAVLHALNTKTKPLGGPFQQQVLERAYPKTLKGFFKFLDFPLSAFCPCSCSSSDPLSLTITSHFIFARF